MSIYYKKFLKKGYAVKKILNVVIIIFVLFAFVACEEQKVPITITLDPNIMFEAPKVIQAMSGDKITLPDAKELWKVQDKIFRGWSTSSNGYPNYEAYSTFSSKTAVRLYALWTDKITYRLNENGYYSVTSYNYSGESTYSIPESYNGLPVKEWTAYWGEDCQISELIIPASITYLSSLPASVYTVSIAASNPVYEMDSNCLIKKDGEDRILLDVTNNFSYIPSNVTKIGNNAFAGSNITDIDIPYGVKEIGSYCFYNCKNLISISIPSSVTTIGDYAFEGCTSLDSITLPSSVYFPATYTHYEFSGYTGKIILAEGWEKIGSNAFTNSDITEIVFPSSLLEIGDFAFSNASRLEKVRIPKSVTTIGFGVFSHNSKTIIIDCSEFSSKPSGWKSNWNYGQTALFMYSEYDDDFVYGDEAKTSVIALRDRSKGEYKFPQSVKTIGSHVFTDTDNLTDLVIPEGIEKLDDFSIYNNNDLKSLTLPSTLKTIGFYAINSCYNLSEVKYNGTTEEWNAISKISDWNTESPFTKIICSNGEVTL